MTTKFDQALILYMDLSRNHQIVTDYDHQIQPGINLIHGFVTKSPKS